jgi:hypothetical protein
MSNSALEALESMGIDVKRVEILDASKSNNKSVDRRICICGHAVDRHKNGNDVPILKSDDPEGKFVCQPNAMTCSCKKCIPVLLVSNPKYFLKRTDGAGEMHALIRGLTGLTTKAENPLFEWLIEPQCRVCSATGSGVLPAAFTLQGHLKKGAGSDGYDAFICKECRIKI